MKVLLMLTDNKSFLQKKNVKNQILLPEEYFMHRIFSVLGILTLIFILSTLNGKDIKGIIPIQKKSSVNEVIVIMGK